MPGRTIGPAPRSAPGAGRLVGLDVARCLALLGMVATHVLDARAPDGDLAFGQWLAGGRASALFAVLAGVTIALSTGGPTSLRGAEWRARCAGLAVRSVLVAVIGLALGELDSGLAVILGYYGVLFLVGLPFTALGARPLIALAAGWALVAPVLSHAVRPSLPERGYDNPTLSQLAEPGRLVSELLFTGYYPVVPWLAYLLLGLAVGRLVLRRRAVAAALAGAGLLLAVLATVVSRALTATDQVARALLTDPPAPGATIGRLLDDIATGMYGTTPTGDAWEWLLVVAPHSATPFDLLQTGGSALLAIGACLLVVDTLPEVPRRAVAVFFGAGTMTLTLYSLHVVMRTPLMWPAEDPDSFVAHVLVLLAIGAVYVALGRRGPLERLVGAAAHGTAALVRGESGPVRRSPDDGGAPRDT